jgi:ubiquinone biosynthesis protein
VAVKVQRPGIQRLIRRDLAILQGFAWLAEHLSHLLRNLRLTVAVREFGRWTLKELDFEIEGHNAEAFRRNFVGWDDVIFPKIYWSHTTARVLTMQRVSGVRVGDVPEKFGPVFARRLATRLAEMEMKMFITDAFFHADLHPGNIFFQPDGSMALLDLGMVGQMTPQQRDRFLAYWITITRR